MFFDLYEEDTAHRGTGRRQHARRAVLCWRCGSSILIFLSWLSKCPTSHLHPVIAGAEWVEVPTIISDSSQLLWTTEQNVDIPVLGRGGRNAGLQGFLPRQSPTAQLASQERISERIVEQIVDSRVFGGGLQDFRPGQSSSPLAKGFFALFPNGKSAKIGPHSGSELSADFTPSTPAAYFSEDRFFYHEDDTKVWLKMESGRWKLLCSEPVVYRDDPRVLE